ARGPSRYYGGDAALATRLLEVVAEVVAGVEAVVGVADGRFASAVAARVARAERSKTFVVPPGRAPTTAFLAPHPVSLLNWAGGVDAALVDLLVRLGLRRVGDVAALQARDLLARFGPAGEAMYRLATGTDDQPPHAVAPPPELTIAHHFEQPITQ